MKKKLGLLSLVLLSVTTAFAQIELEHEYAWKNAVFRNVLDNNIGVKYTYQNNEEKKYEIYNEDHSLWKSIHITTLSTEEDSSVEVIYVGAAVAKDDDDLGVIVNITENNTETSKLYILTESEPLVNVSAVAEAENERGRFVGSSYVDGVISQVAIEYGAESGDWENYTKIYNALTLEEEFTLNHGAVQYIETIENEHFWIAINNDERSYWVYDLSGDLLFTIPLPYALGIHRWYGANGEHILSKHLHNTDDEYELLIGYLQNNSFPIENNGYLLSQDGTIVQSINAYSFTAEKGADDFERIVALRSEGANEMLMVYDLGMTEILQEYVAPIIERYRLDGYGEMITVGFSAFSPTVVVYHEDGSIWEEKEITSFPGTFRGDIMPTRNIFNDDESLEYIISHIESQAASTYVIVETSAGEYLLGTVGGDLFSMDFFPGEANKLFIRGTFSNALFTSVYSTPSTLPFLSVNEWLSDENIRLYPNPVNNQIHLNIGSETKVFGEIFLYDMMGKLVLQQFFDHTDVTLSVEHLNPGVYNVLIKSGNSSSNTKFIKM